MAGHRVSSRRGGTPGSSRCQGHIAVPPLENGQVQAGATRFKSAEGMEMSDEGEYQTSEQRSELPRVPVREGA